MTNSNTPEKKFDDMTDEEKEVAWDKTLESQESEDFLNFLFTAGNDEIARGSFTED